MIVLDEQLLGRNLEREIGAWYPGAVCFITELRPDTVIKDDAIPSILRDQPQATFVTINATDFWEIVQITADFCVICLAIPDSQVNRVSTMIRDLLSHPRFALRASRMGCVIRASTSTLTFYTSSQRTIETL